MATAMSGVAAAKMNLRPVNKSALRRYQQFWRSLVMLDASLAGVAMLIARAEDYRSERSYRVPDAEELGQAVVKVERAVQQMISESKRWEAELVSRDWR
jgi:hypothetical protein